MIQDKNYKEDDSLVELLRYKDRLRIALKAAKACVFEVDLTRQLYTFFENSEDIFGVSGESILKEVKPFSILSPSEYQAAASEYFSHPGDSEVIGEAFKSILGGKSATYNARMKAGNTKYIWCKVDVTPIVENGIPVRMIGIINDISEIKEKADNFEKETRLDSFSGLYTKVYFEESMKNILNSDVDQKHALIIFDLDNFKEINDTLGHMVGDEVLKSVSDSLKKIFRKSDIVSRFGGDEFVIFLRNIHSEEEVENKIHELLKTNDNDYNVTKSIGAAIFPDDAKEYKELLCNADRALYNSKNKKNTYTLFSNLI